MVSECPGEEGVLLGGLESPSKMVLHLFLSCLEQRVSFMLLSLKQLSFGTWSLFSLAFQSTKSWLFTVAENFTVSLFGH